MAKINFRKQIHDGVHPVSILKFNILNRLTDRNFGYLNELIRSEKLSNHFIYIQANNSKKIKTPYIHNENIVIEENFIAFIWIASYYFFVIHEENHAIPFHIKHDLKTHKKHTPEIIPKAHELFQYGLSLYRNYSKWDINYYPNPEYYDPNSDEGFYIERTNDLFLEIIYFLINHELAHAEYEHIKKKNSKGFQKSEIKSLEYEADERAIKNVLSNSIKNSKLAIPIAFGITLFLNHKIKSKNHPDLDDRLENAINSMNLSNESQVWSMLSIIILKWNETFDIEISIKKDTYDDYKELFYELFNNISNIKQL